jgi:uncharacterized RDD family membrane protein YckC
MPEQTSQLDSRVEIVTAENIAFHYRLAGPYRRLIAYLIDLGIRALAAAVAVLVALLVFGTLGQIGFVAAAGLAAYFVLDWFYGGLFETFWNGQTPGKRLLQLRVISTNGQPVSGWQAVLRNVLRAVDAAPLAAVIPTFQLGFLVMLLNARFQRIGDLAAGTMVVVEEPQRLYGVTRVTEPAAMQLAAELPANFAASRGLGRALSAYVSRRLSLGWTRRDEIARHLAEPLRARFNLPPTTNPDVLLCALYHRVFIADLAADKSGGTPFARPAAGPQGAAWSNGPQAISWPNAQPAGQRTGPAGALAAEGSIVDLKR